jgi:hypothetical protein
MRNYKKRGVLNNALRGAAAVILVMIVIPACYLIFFVRDIPRFDDSSMKITRIKVPRNKNAYNLLVQAQVPLNDQVTADMWEELQKLAKEAETMGGLSPESRQKAMLDFKERFEMIERAALLPYSQGPQLSGPGDRIPNYLSIRALARLRLEIALSDFMEGRRDEAVEAVTEMLRLGKNVQQTDGGSILIDEMIGINIKGMALSYLNEMISGGYLPEKGNRELDAALAVLYERPEPWISAWKTEYLVNCNTIRDLGKLRSRDFAYILSGDVTSGGHYFLENDYTRYFFFKLFFRPEKTRKLLFDYYSKYIRNSEADYFKDMEPVDISDYTKFGTSTGVMVKSALKGDLGALNFAAVAIPNFQRAFQKKYYTDFQIDAMRLRIAALEYKRDKKQLPPSLNALAPDYIDAVPADPFDGQPIRYDVKRGLIYSVGRNLKDDGGDASAFLFTPEIVKPDMWDKQKDFVAKVE